MNRLQKNDAREQLLELQIEKEKNLVKAQELVLKNLDLAIKEWNPATVASMAEILKA
jgi:hypothetical protein